MAIGMRKKIIALFTWVNEHLFFEPNEENGLFGQTLNNSVLNPRA